MDNKLYIHLIICITLTYNYHPIIFCTRALCVGWPIGSPHRIISWSPDIPQGTTSDDEDEELEVAHDKALAEEVNPRLSEEVRRWGTLGVESVLNTVLC